MTHTIYGLLAQAAGKFSNAIAIGQGDHSLSYAELMDKAHRVAGALLSAQELPTGTAVAMIAPNSLQWVIASLALQALGLVECPREQEGDDAAWTGFFLRTQCRFCIVGDAPTAGRIRSLPLPWQGEITVWTLDELCARTDPIADCQTVIAVIQDRQQGIRADDLAVVIRSSGTTGPSKQVMLSHASYLHTARHVPVRIGLRADDVCLLCLPLWHLYARLVLYVVLAQGARIELCELTELPEAFQRVRPMLFPGFPVVWTYLYHRVWDHVDSRRFLRSVFTLLLSVSRRFHEGLYRAKGREVRLHELGPAAQQLRRLRGLLEVVMLWGPFVVTDRLIFRRIRQVLGGRLRAAIIGDAPLPLSIDRDLRALGFPVLEGYGSSEQMIAALRGPDTNVTGSVGQTLPEVDLRIVGEAGIETRPGQIGEILVRGPQVFLGYMGEPERSRQSLVEWQGKTYYSTGDLGRIDYHGNLLVIGRKVNRISLNDGCFLYPELTENALRGIRYVAQSVVFPARGARLLALIVPEFESLVGHFGHVVWRGSPPLAELPPNEASRALVLRQQSQAVTELLAHPAVLSTLRAQLLQVLHDSHLEPQQWPSHFALFHGIFVRGEELTHTLKLRRDYIREKYASGLVHHPLE